MIALLLALSGCAPPGVGPPPVPLAADQRFEAGGILTGGSMVPYSEDLRCQYFLQACAGLSAQAYGYRAFFDHRLDVGLTAFGGNTSGFGAGGFLRLWYLDEPDFRLGGELHAGLFWASAGVPVAKQVRPGWWLYASPSVGVRYIGLLRLPVGVSWQPNERLLFSMELGASWDPWGLFQDPEAVFVFGSFTGAYRFRGRSGVDGLPIDE
ncbi:MAG: hypothetical protein H6739_23330 [Alphaproteobacteria bacterium]|nr:hypothetical protein [Alphaproteobacteria bacterium]